jgi:copper transport protein
MRANLRLVVAIAASILLSVLVSQSAGAHANLLDSIPKANEQLEQPPALVELFFSEAIESSFSTIEVLDVNGIRVDNEDARVDTGDPSRMRATLRSLPDGVYTVSWRTLSAVDSHITAGVFPFAVGAVDSAALEGAVQAGQRFNVSPAEVITRWLTFLSSMAVTGGMLFLLVVWLPTMSIAGNKEEIGLPWQRINTIALLILLLVSLFWLLIQAGQAKGAILVTPWSPAFRQVLFSTRFGALWLARVAVALCALWLVQRKPSARISWSLFILGLLILLTISMGSHAAAEPDPLIPIIIDWIHLIAASVWVGGLIHFVSALWTMRGAEIQNRIAVTAVLIPRFSVTALISVGVIVITGSYASILHIGSFSELISTAYGRTLLVKLAFFLPMVVLGAVNLLHTSPQMKNAAREVKLESPIPQFRRLIRSEVIFAILVLLSVALLTTLPPAAVPDSTPSISGTQQTDDLAVALDVSPGRPGSNRFLVTIDSNGETPENVREVSLKFTPSTVEIPPSSVKLEDQGDGQFSTEGGYLALADKWQVQVAVRKVDTFDSFANFDLNISSSSGGLGQDTSQSIPWHRITGMLTVTAAIMLGLVLTSLFKDGGRIILAAIVPIVLISAVGVFVFFDKPVEDLITMANPIPSNLESLTTGQELYQANCFPCHGPSGAGDGPVGMTLNPPPADLTVHTAPGVHLDGQLFEWITNGLPGSVMPAFVENLSDEERWHLVNYIRTLAQP